jgi:hypothetical protein
MYAAAAAVSSRCCCALSLAAPPRLPPVMRVPSVVVATFCFACCRCVDVHRFSLCAQCVAPCRARAAPMRLLSLWGAFITSDARCSLSVSAVSAVSPVLVWCARVRLLISIVCSFSGSLVRPKIASSVHYCEATKAFSTMEYRDSTSLRGAATSSVYPTKVCACVRACACVCVCVCVGVCVGVGVGVGVCAVCECVSVCVGVSVLVVVYICGFLPCLVVYVVCCVCVCCACVLCRTRTTTL